MDICKKKSSTWDIITQIEITKRYKSVILRKCNKLELYLGINKDANRCPILSRLKKKHNINFKSNNKKEKSIQNFFSENKLHSFKID
jgi:predicted glycosyltransferase